MRFHRTKSQLLAQAGRCARKYLKILAALLLLQPLTVPGNQVAAAEFRVLASTFPIYLFTMNVCHDARDIKVELLIPAVVGCPHDFALRPADLLKLDRADALVINGGGLEEFLDKPLLGKKIPIVDAGKDVPMLPEAFSHGDHSHMNAHIFSAPKWAAMMVKNIAAQLTRLNKPNAEIFERNSRAYIATLLAISQRLERIGANAANRKIALAHDALAYLANNAGLEVCAVFENTESPAGIARLTKLLIADNVALLGGDAQYSDRMVKLLSQETKIPWVMLDPCSNGPADAPLDYYERKMEENLRILEDKLD